MLRRSFLCNACTFVLLIEFTTSLLSYEYAAYLFNGIFIVSILVNSNSRSGLDVLQPIGILPYKLGHDPGVLFFHSRLSIIVVHRSAFTY